MFKHLMSHTQVITYREVFGEYTYCIDSVLIQSNTPDKYRIAASKQRMNKALITD